MPEKIGQYTVVSQLGRGGMGVVYKARDESLNRFVAIKVLSEALNEDATLMQRFVREAQAAAGLSHPNIVQIFYIGEDNGHPYFVMEYVSGRSLDQLLRSEGRIDNPRASQLILQAAHGLAAAHDKGIVHRDIKPANLILDDRGLLKIADFGLALPADAQTQLTQTGMFVGTPGYLAPEQVSGEKADNRTDIYALGVTFYLLLTGTPPFRGDSPLALVKQIIDSEPADVSTLNPSVDAETRRILGKMIAKDRAQRYQSCHELVSDLEEYLATRGVRSMTAGLATRVPSSSPELAAAASAPTQNISRQEAQSAPTIIQSPLASPVTQPDMPPARRSSAVTILVVAVVLLMLIGGGIGAAVFGTRMFRNWQQHKSEETAAKQPEPPPATATATATPPAATAHEGVLLSDAVKLPAATTDSSAAQPAVVAPAPAPVPVAVSAPKQTPLAAEKPAVRARAGVVIAATGDPQLLGAVSEVLRSEMRSAGIDVVDAQTLPATEDLLRGGGVSAGRLIDGLSGERYAVLLLARVEPTGQRELSYYGRHDIAYSSRVTLTAYDLATGKPFGSSPSATIEYTSLNAQDKSEEAVGPLAQEIAGTIRAH